MRRFLERYFQIMYKKCPKMPVQKIPITTMTIGAMRNITQAAPPPPVTINALDTGSISYFGSISNTNQGYLHDRNYELSLVRDPKASRPASKFSSVFYEILHLIEYIKTSYPKDFSIVITQWWS